MSVKTPVAASWTVVPSAMVGLGGVMSIRASVAAVTCSVAEPVMAPSVA
jgi:hypothetical protein